MFGYIDKLSIKSNLGVFLNFAYNKIEHLEAPQLLLLGFSTVSAGIHNQPKWYAQLIFVTYSFLLYFQDLI